MGRLRVSAMVMVILVLGSLSPGNSHAQAPLCPLLFKPDGRIVIETAELSIAANERAQSGDSTFARILFKHLKEKLAQAKAAGVDVSDFSEVVRALKLSAAEAGRPEKAREARAKQGEAVFGPWQEKVTLEGHTGDVYDVAISSDGEFILTASADKTAVVWDRLGHQRLKIEHPAAVELASFSPDGSKLMTIADGRVYLWDHHAQPIRNFEIGRARKVKFSADGQRILEYGGFDVSVWDLNGQRLITKSEGAQVWTDVNSNGIILVTYPRLRDFATLWDLNGNLIRKVPLPPGVRSVAINDDGTRLVLVGNGGLQVIDQLGQTRFQEEGLAWEALGTPSFGPDGMFAASRSRGGGAIYVWDNAGNRFQNLIPERQVEKAVLSPNGRELVSIGKSGYTAVIWGP